MTDQALKPQTMLRDYAIKRVLGRGAFGITYLAEHLTDREAVAVKEYFPSDAAERDADGTTVNPSRRRAGHGQQAGQDFQSGLEKFMEEARVLTGFRSPHIVQVVDTFELHGTAYMVMRYEKGGTLARYLHSHQKPLDEGQILSVFVPVLEGLRTIHAKWLLHRDIKPENIYIREDGSPLLIDFGTARHALSGKQGGMTEYLTPGYAPPEQYDRHDDHGPWTDIYAVGATMYYCVTRIVPPEGRSRVGTEDPVMPAVQAAPSFYDRELLEVIDWMMTPDARARPQSVDEVLERLEGLRAREAEDIEEGQEELAATMARKAGDADTDGESVHATLSGLAPSVTDESEIRTALADDGTEKLDTVRHDAPPPRSGPDSKTGWLIAAAATALLVVAAGLLISQNQPSAPESDETRQAAADPPEETTVASDPAAVEPEEIPVAQEESESSLVKQLKVCRAHMAGGRLATGAGGNAFDCYQQVLEKDPGNDKALAGIKEIEHSYASWARSALEEGRIRSATTALDKLRKLNPDHPVFEEVVAAKGRYYGDLPAISGLGDYHALVIGNGDYEHFPSLSTPKNDARAVAEVLESRYGYDTKLLLDANRFEILSVLNDYRARLAETDNLLIYYAGRGELDTSIDDTVGFGISYGYWLPVDSEKVNPANWISTRNISELLNVIAAKHVLVVTDSCYSKSRSRSEMGRRFAAGGATNWSGTIRRYADAVLQSVVRPVRGDDSSALNALERLEKTKTADEWVAWFKKVSQLRARMVLRDAGPVECEEVLSSDSGKYSLFGEAFLEILKEQEGAIDGYKFYLTVSERIAKETESRGLGRRFTPYYSSILHAGDEIGEFIFQPLSSNSPVKAQLGICRDHFSAKRLTTGTGGNAYDCYQQVLEKDPGNDEALAGLEEIENTYATWAHSALEDGRTGNATTHLAKLQKLSPNHPIFDETAPPPEIELIEPPVTFTGDGQYTAVVGATAQTREVIGKVLAPVGVLSLNINEQPVEINDSGLFNTAVKVTGARTPVSIVAVDGLRRRASVSFDLLRESSEAETAAVNPGEVELPVISGLGDYHALIIGNSDYEDFPRLPTAGKDARAVAQVLKNHYGYDTKLLLNADRFEILSALNEYRADLAKSDNLLIYYSGHGEIDKVNDNGYWLPVDSEKDNTANWISTRSISEILNVTAAKHVLVVADSCYSGTLTRSALARLQTGRSRDEWVEWFKKVGQVRTRMVMSAGGEAPVDIGAEHALFTGAFLKALEENVSVVDGYRLFLSVYDATKNIVNSRKLNIAEKPQYAPIKYAGHEAGEYIFRRR